jgi:LPXTG-motif cell wall-anchored protein
MESTPSTNSNNSKNYLFIGIIAALTALSVYLYMGKNKAENQNHATGEAMLHGITDVYFTPYCSR